MLLKWSETKYAIILKSIKCWNWFFYDLKCKIKNLWIFPANIIKKFLIVNSNLIFSIRCYYLSLVTKNSPGYLKLLKFRLDISIINHKVKVTRSGIKCRIFCFEIVIIGSTSYWISLGAHLRCYEWYWVLGW